MYPSNGDGRNSGRGVAREPEAGAGQAPTGSYFAPVGDRERRGDIRSTQRQEGGQFRYQPDWPLHPDVSPSGTQRRRSCFGRRLCRTRFLEGPRTSPEPTLLRST